MIKTAVVGCGYWGRLLIRNLSHHPDYHLRYFCDVDDQQLARLKDRHGYVNSSSDLEPILRDNAVDAVVIATPLASHYDIARRCLLAGKHILVEQPFAESAEQCEELIEIAAKEDLLILVDHIDEYNTTLRQLKKLIARPAFGDIMYLYSQRLTLTTKPSRAGGLMDLASHDFYITTRLLGMEPIRIMAQGLFLLGGEREDVVFATMDFGSGVSSHIHASWVDPNKVRRLTVVGTGQMIVYDDISPDEKIKIYTGHANPNDEDTSDHQVDDSFGQHFNLQARTGDVIIPRTDIVEPMRLLVEDFAFCIKHDSNPQVDCRTAADLVRLLGAARESIEGAGIPIETRELS